MSNAIVHGDLVLFDCPRIRKGEYWQFIRLVAPAGRVLPEGQSHWLSQDATDAYCLKCHKLFRFTKGSSNSVRRHMERFHRKELLKRQAQLAEGKRLTLASKRPSKIPTMRMESADGDEEEPPRPDNDHPGSPVPVPAATATTTTIAGSRKRLRVADAPDSRMGTELLLKWLAGSLRPLTIVEDSGFAAFTEFLSGAGDGGFTVPTIAAARHHLELTVEAYRFDSKERIKSEVSFFSLVAEVWRVRQHEDATTTPTHAVLTCAHLTDNFELRTWVVDAMPLQNQSVEVLRERLSVLLQDCGLQASSLTTFLLPECDKLECVARLSSFRVLRDVTDVVGQLTSRCMQWITSNDSPLPAVSDRLVISPEAKVTCSSGFGELLLALKTQMTDPLQRQKLTTLTPSGAKDLETWMAQDDRHRTFQSTLEFLTRILANKAALETWMAPDASGSTGVLCPASWLVIDGLVQLWRPLQEVVQVVSNEKARSVAFLVPILATLLRHFSRENLFDESMKRHLTDADRQNGGDRIARAMTTLDTLRRGMERHLGDHYGEFCNDMSWVAALDPRYGRLRHLAEDEREVCKGRLIDQAMDVYASQMPPAGAEPLAALAPDVDGTAMLYGDARHVPQGIVPGLMHRLLYDEDEDVVAPTDVLSREAELAQTRLYVTNEVTMYLNEHLLRKTRISCPLQWWHAHKERYPFLAPLARVWLGTVACRPSGEATRILPAELCEDLPRTTGESLPASSSSAAAVVTTPWLQRTSDQLFLHSHLRNGIKSSISL